ncbi:Tex-like N-terminal domain-containing protein, partial [Flavobacterium sp.]|uniref:Tex-like N-terminal domain-containing protein n=1 Tax=Flavobacterium sp. TaxID=239 RepID=UPI002BD38381
MTNIQFIKSVVNTADKNIEATLKLLSEDCTIPFISRYRKDATGNLDEVQIEQIAKLSKQYDDIVKRKESVLNSIEEQGQLSAELKSKI